MKPENFFSDIGLEDRELCNKFHAIAKSAWKLIWNDNLQTYDDFDLLKQAEHFNSQWALPNILTGSQLKQQAIYLSLELLLDSPWNALMEAL